MPDIIAKFNVELSKSLNAVDDYSTILSKETTFNYIDYRVYYETLEEQIQNIKCSSKIFSIHIKSRINLLEFVWMLATHPYMLKETEILILDPLRNIDNLTNWINFAKAILTNDEVVLAPKMKHFEMVNHGGGRLNGVFHALTEGGLSQLYKAHPDFERLILHSNYIPRFWGGTPEGEKFEDYVPARD